MPELTLPPAVAERMAKLKERPVVLEVEDLGKTFATPKGPVTAIGKLDLQIHRREFTCIIGPSGCGKSTLVRILAGLETQSRGQVLLDGNPVAGPGPERGMVFQSYTLFPWLSVKKNVMFGLEMQGTLAARAESEAMQWLEMVGLEQFGNHYPHQLSGGMKQRVAIARALAAQPRILFMDEPFAALDAQTRASMQRHLLAIWRNINLTVAFITHDLDEAVLLSDRIIVLGANPGHLQEVIEVPLPRERNPDIITDPAFLATRERLEELIHGGKTTEETLPPVPRMVPIGDEV